MFDSQHEMLFRAIARFSRCDDKRPLQSRSKLIFQGDPSAPAVILNPTKKAALDLAHEGYTHTHRFAVLPSYSAPRWLLPLGNPSWTIGGAEIYTPYAPMAQKLKHLLVRLIALGLNAWARHRVLVASRDSLPLELLVAEVTGEHYPVFALSLGNQPAVRKLTVQVMRQDGEILGYVKLPLTRIATERVRHEAKMSERLWNFPALRPHIPRVLYSGVWNESHILFQSALPGGPGPTTFTRMHEDFLASLWNVHRIEKPGRILVEAVGEKWGKVVELLGAKWQELGQEALRRSAQDPDWPTIPCGVSHGDFAPWNSRVQEGILRFFDWESADWETPTLWDIFHFHLQTALSLKQRVAGSTILDQNLSRGAPYLLYLLSSTIQFLEEKNWAAIDHRRKLLAKELESTVYIQSDAPTVKRRAVRLIDRGAGSRQPLSPSGPGRPAIVTTSWDDGDPMDIKIAELLRCRGLPGTFYIPMSGYLGRTTLTPADLRVLSSEGFEIGAHSVSHKTLTLLTGEQLQREVRVCKQNLEQLIGREVPMFCYPNGRYNSAVVHETKCAGYEGARTTRMLAHRLRFTPFEMPTTLHAYPHGKSAYLRNLGRARNLRGLCEYAVRFGRIDSWVKLGKMLFDSVLQEGGMWHLYGHSWEIEELRMWPDLQEMLNYVCNRRGVTYVTNHQLLGLLKSAARIGSGAEGLEADREIAQI